MYIFNSHVHTDISKDGKSTADEVCRSAEILGLAGISVTDHCEISSFISENSYQRTKASVTKAAALKEAYKNRLFVGIGTEIGDEMLNRQYTGRILRLADFDVVLASVHVICIDGKIIHLSRVDFSTVSDGIIDKYMNTYFTHILETAEKGDFDVLSHLTLPLRYITAQGGKNVNMSDYASQIDRILKTVIRRDKAIEVNTSEINRIGLMPDKTILSRYRELGGKKVTIGSDAHTAKNLTSGLHEAISVLKDCGFTQYGYYNKRKYVSVNIL